MIPQSSSNFTLYQQPQQMQVLSQQLPPGPQPQHQRANLAQQKQSFSVEIGGGDVIRQQHFFPSAPPQYFYQPMTTQPQQLHHLQPQPQYYAAPYPYGATQTLLPIPSHHHHHNNLSMSPPQQHHYYQQAQGQQPQQFQPLPITTDNQVIYYHHPQPPLPQPFLMLPKQQQQMQQQQQQMQQNYFAQIQSQSIQYRTPNSAETLKAKSLSSTSAYPTASVSQTKAPVTISSLKPIVSQAPSLIQVPSQLQPTPPNIIQALKLPTDVRSQSTTCQTTTVATQSYPTTILPSPPKPCRIKFRVYCKTMMNQQVAVVGNISALGSWQLSKAIHLSTDLEKYPVWAGEILVIHNENKQTDDEQQLTEYKFFTFSTNDDQTQKIEWEQIEGNREIKCGKRLTIIVKDIYGEKENHQEHSADKQIFRKPIQNLKLSNQQYHPDEELKKIIKEPEGAGDICQNSLSNTTTQYILKQNKEEIFHLDQPNLKQNERQKRSQGRQRLKAQLQIAFPNQIQQVKNQKSKSQMMVIKKREQQQQQNQYQYINSDTTSNFSGSQNGSRSLSRSLNSSLRAPRQRNMLIAKKYKPKTVKLDPHESIIQVSLQLPYRLISRESGQFEVEPSYQSPSFLYANLDDLGQTQTYNFVWVGIVVTKHKMTEQEEFQASKILAEKKCYGIYFTEEQITPYLRFYERLIRPNMHNFVDPSDHLKTSVLDWSEFKKVNAQVANKVHKVRQLLNSHTIWVHGDQFMLVPYYIRQSEKIKANLGFYFHQAFPASAVFQAFYKREELLQSLLHSDLIGFHIWEYARNFINSCQRLLGLYYELGVGNTLSVNYNKRSVQVRIWHIGLDESFLEKIMSGQKYEQAQQKVINTVRLAATREQRNNTRATTINNRNNLNTIQTNIRSASQPTLIGGLGHAGSRTSTLADSFEQNSSQDINDALNGKIILASIDSLQPTTGLILKLKGYYRFLKMYPEYRSKVVLFQIIRGLFLKSDNMKGEHADQEESKQHQARQNVDKNTIWLSDQVEALDSLNQSICRLVTKIRNEFGRQCLIVESGNWPIHARLALWSKAHVLFVSTLKDGLYLTCFEYILVKYLSNEFENSALILSEFTGSNSQFAGFYEFNPFLLKTTVAALEKCLKDSPKEKADRMKRAFMYCRQRTFRKWVESFLKELKLAYDPHTVDDTRILYQGLQVVQIGGRSSKCQENNEAYQRNILPAPLDIKKYALQAVNHRKNLIMIDHEALPFKQLGRSEMCPRSQIIHWIQEILYDKNNIVMIMSDRDRNYVSSVFESNLMEQENFWVAAESGYWQMTNSKQWKELFKVQNKQWMQTIRQIMEEYCLNIDGTNVDERSCTVVWNYKNAEEEHGSKFANELQIQLEHQIGRNSPLEIVHGNGFIEVQPKNLAKTTVLKNVLENLHLYCNHQIESFMYIGAELSEDKTFKFLHDRIDEDKHKQCEHSNCIDESKPLFAVNCKSALCVLGNRPSRAHFYLEQKDVQYLLQEMAFKTQSRKRNKSWTNLHKTDDTSNNLNQSKDGSGFTQFLPTTNRSFNNEEYYDLYNDETPIQQALQKLPQRKSLSMKRRRFSHMSLFQAQNINEKKGIYQIDEGFESIKETQEEDNMTLQSEYISGYEAGSSIHKNTSSEHVVNSRNNSRQQIAASTMQQNFSGLIDQGNQAHQNNHLHNSSNHQLSRFLGQRTISQEYSESTWAHTKSQQLLISNSESGEAILSERRHSEFKCPEQTQMQLERSSSTLIKTEENSRIVGKPHESLSMPQLN